MAKANKLKEMPAVGKSTAASSNTRIIDRFYPNGVDLEDDAKKQLIQILNEKLAESFDIYSQAKFAHWNVKGTDFYQLHLLFDKIAEIVEPHADMLAERITALGGVANGTVRQAAQASRIPEYDVDAVLGMDHVRALSRSLAQHCASMRDALDKTEEVGADPTHDFLNQMIIELEQGLYFLESHLEAGGAQKQNAR